MCSSDLVEFLLELFRRECVGTILQHHRKTADRPQARNRGHTERLDDRAWDIHGGLVEAFHHGILHLVPIFPFRKIFQNHDTQCAVAGIEVIDEVKTGNENNVPDFGDILEGFLQMG